MQTILETERLLLRPRTMEHLASCLVMDGDPEVMEYVGGLPADPQAHRARLIARISAAFPPGQGYWSVFAKSDPDRFLGWVLLIPHEELAPATETGWRLVRSAWGSGYATEASAAVLRHAFEDLRLEHVVADIHPGNARSAAVARKIGLRFAGDATYAGEPCKRYELTSAAYWA